MASLVETDEFTASIYQLEIADAPEGGALGIDNVQPRQLANRTLWLKNRLAEHSAAADPHPQYMTAAEGDAAIAASVAALVNASPAALDTLNELAVALGNDANFAATMAAALATKLTEAQASALYAPLGFTVPVRQTVLSGNVDVNGYSSFGGAAGSAIVNAATTLKATAAYADTNRVGSIVNPQWTGLNTNGTMYLGLTINADGTCTPFATALAPVYQWGGAYATTAGQRTFNIQEMTMKVGNGAAAVQSYDVFVGEVTVAGGVVSAITWYALMSRYDSGWFALVLSTTYTKAANLGVIASSIEGYISKNPTGIPAFKAVWNPDSDGTRSNGCLIEQTNINTVKLKTEYSSLSTAANSNYLADVPGTTGYGRIVMSRGW